MNERSCSACSTTPSRAIFFGYLFMSIILGLSIVTGVVYGQSQPADAALRGLNTRLIRAGELKAFDGKEGRPAYFAYDGLIYDVTRSNWWKDGKHPGGNLAGNDLSGRLEKAPHGSELFQGFQIVGVLEGSESAATVEKANRPTGFVLLLGKTLTAWSGYLLGFFFILNFWTCCVMPWKMHLLPWKGKRPGQDEFDEKGFFHLTSIHRPLAWLTIIFGTLHGVLGVFQSFGIYI